jgi:hypothetical protein
MNYDGRLRAVGRVTSCAPLPDPEGGAQEADRDFMFIGVHS